jgi:hypothetical protein
MNECQKFRTLLESELMRPGTNPQLRTLSWHEHLLGCANCRELLAAEEALELLLSSLPEPRLPEHLARRVLLRLRSSRLAGSSGSLDELLEIDAEPVIPSGLSSRVLSALEPERQAPADGLERLLDRYQVREPSGLADRVLAGLENERAAPVLAFHQRGPMKLLLASAAAALVFISAYRLSKEDEKALRPSTEVAFADPQLLEDYYVLDNWNLLLPESDVELLIATAIEPEDEVALALDGE